MPSLTFRGGGKWLLFYFYQTDMISQPSERNMFANHLLHLLTEGNKRPGPCQPFREQLGSLGNSLKSAGVRPSKQPQPRDSQGPCPRAPRSLRCSRRSAAGRRLSRRTAYCSWRGNSICKYFITFFSNTSMQLFKSTPVRVHLNCVLCARDLRSGVRWIELGD